MKMTKQEEVLRLLDDEAFQEKSKDVRNLVVIEMTKNTFEKFAIPKEEMVPYVGNMPEEMSFFMHDVVDRPLALIGRHGFIWPIAHNDAVTEGKARITVIR